MKCILPRLPILLKNLHTRCRIVRASPKQNDRLSDYPAVGCTVYCTGSNLREQLVISVALVAVAHHVAAWRHGQVVATLDHQRDSVVVGRGASIGRGPRSRVARAAAGFAH
ncbi:jg15888 [Pararge aegeria aegeria]|uniref:Jg15888 protein n=1 Tax=Pararge aegeria aegeria TaxID=348720 RepID=A0A8S4SIN7_9NEOP|nr:jg15888 [Pararge aegeria aegeria]